MAGKARSSRDGGTRRARDMEEPPAKRSRSRRGSQGEEEEEEEGAMASAGARATEDGDAAVEDAAIPEEVEEDADIQLAQNSAEPDATQPGADLTGPMQTQDPYASLDPNASQPVTVVSTAPAGEGEDDRVRFRKEIGGDPDVVEFVARLKVAGDDRLMDLATLADASVAKAGMADVMADVLDLARRDDFADPVSLLAACLARVDSGGVDLYKAVDARYVRALSRILALCGQAEERGMEEMKTGLHQCIWRLYSTVETVSCVLKSKMSAKELGSLPELIGRALALPKKINEFQCLIILMTTEWVVQKLRRGEGNDDGVYRCQRTAEGHDTHHWTKWCTLSEWVSEECDFTRTVAWSLGSKDGARKRMTEWIAEGSKRNSFAFEIRPRDRGVFAFRNGIYVCETDRWFRYPAADLPDDVGACRFFENVDMDESLFEEGRYGGDFDDGEWMDIETDAVKKILDDQDFPENVQRPFWALAVGRMLYALRKMDKFECMCFLKGVGGSGKSTLVRIVDFIYGRDAGVLSNTIEPLFGLSQLKDKYVVYSYELNDKFNLAQSDWLSLVSGETLNMPEKHKEAAVKPWTAPFLAAGNRMFSLGDNAGQVTRRMILFPFDNKPRGKSDASLDDKISSNIARIIVKGNRAYRGLVRKVGTDSLIEHLPEWFQDCRRRALEASNPLYTFLNHVSWVEVNLEHNYCPWEEFQKRFLDWNRQRDPRSRIVFEEDFYKHVFAEFKLKLVFEKVWKVYPVDQDPVDGRVQKKKAFYLYGVDFESDNAAAPPDA